MTSRSNNYIKQIFNIFKIIITVFAVLVIASCPEPMTDDLLAEVEDTVGPIITVTSPVFTPQTKYYYQSDINIVGLLKDYSDPDSTIEGSIDSVVVVDLNYKGITLAPDNDIPIDETHFYTFPDGRFEIYIDTLDPLNPISGDFTLQITAVDWNGNSTPKELDLFDDVSGPNIGIDDHSASDYNVYSSTLVGSPLTISGIVEMPYFQFEYQVEVLEAGGGTSIPLTDVPDVLGDGSFSFLFNPYGEGLSKKIKFIFRADDGIENVEYFYLHDDPDAPLIDSYTFPATNDTITLSILSSGLPVFGNEGLYTTVAGATGNNAVTEADFDLLLDGLPLTWSFSAAPAEADESFIINFTGIPATPDGTEILTFAPKANAVFDRVGNPANPAVFLITENLHDKQVPTVSSVTQTDATHVDVVFSEDVNEAQAETFAYYSNPDTPSIPATGAILSGGDTVTLTFGSAIDPGDGLNITGGVINDLDNNPLAVVTGHFIIDAVSPTITSIDSTALSGPFNDTDTITIDVHFDETVTLVGTATLNLDSLGTATSSDTSGTDLTFTYIIQAGEGSSDLDVLSLTGGTIQDLSFNDLDRTLPALSNLGDNENIVIDAVAPTITSIDSSAGTGPFNDTDTITIDVHFDETVTLVGTAILNLDSLGTATCSDTSGTDLTFTYIIQAGEGSLDLDVISLTGGTIQDLSFNDLDRTLPALSNLGDNENIVIDAVAPTITSIDSSAGTGPFNDTDTITIDVHFDETVTLVGTATLNLDSGGTATSADTSGIDLTFTYIIQAGEDSGDLDVISLTGGTFQDGSGNDLNRTLPVLSNLSDNEDIEIDNTAPELESVILVDNGSPGADDGDAITFNFNDEIALGSLVANDTPDDPNKLISNIGTIATESGFAFNEATTSTLVIIGNTITITLQGVAADEHGLSMPEGIFTPDSGLEDLAGNQIIIATNPDEVIVSGSWDAIDPVTITSHVASPYISGQVVSVTLSSEAGATIYYTTDGTDPSISSTEYSSSFDITGTSTTVTLKFFAVDVYNNQESIKSEDFIFP